VEAERLDQLDVYRMANGATVELSQASPAARAFVADLALRLAQGQGYAELLARVMQPNLPIYEGRSPLDPGVHDLPAFKAARDLVYRAGIAEGAIQAGPADHVQPLPTSLRALHSAEVANEGARGSGLTTEAIVTVGEAMHMLGITRQAVINATRTGRIRGEQHGKVWVLSRDDVLRYRMQRDERKRER
jgi:hypothetical protein